MTSRNLKWLVLIALTAIALRVYAIERLPLGLFGDEAVEGLDALDVLAGNFQIWFHAHLGREPIYVYLVAVSYALFGISPLTTRLPALFIGLATVPVTYFFVREWSARLFLEERSKRLALLTCGLLAISFWHIQLTRNAHRDTLLPLVIAAGAAFLWRGLRTQNWRWYVLAGAVFGLAIYTYSPGRFVAVFIAAFFLLEYFLVRLGKSSALIAWRGVLFAAVTAIVIMLPLGVYFAQNPAQFVRRFDSASILGASEPLAALAASVGGNLAMFVMPEAGYQSKHYNVPGKPIFDLFLAPWFVAGLVIVLLRVRESAYRFLLIWFAVMLLPAFLTADMIPKGVRAFGVLPGALLFLALAMDGALERARAHERVVKLLIGLTFAASTIWTTYDYFVTWANLKVLPIAFDADYAEASEYIQSLPATEPVYVSAEVYRHPTFMLLGKRVPTSAYYDRSARIREFDATRALVYRNPEAVTIFVRDQSPAEDWYRRLAPHNERVAGGQFFTAYRLHDLAPPQERLDQAFNPMITLSGYSNYREEPFGMALYWRVAALPTDRGEMRVHVILQDTQGKTIREKTDRFGYPPMEWAIGETIVTWYEFDSMDRASQFRVELARGGMNWKSKEILLR